MKKTLIIFVLTILIGCSFLAKKDIKQEPILGAETSFADFATVSTASSTLWSNTIKGLSSIRSLVKGNFYVGNSMGLAVATSSIYSNGKFIGIGTTIPTSLLQVSAQTGTTTLTIGNLNTSPGCLKIVNTAKTGYVYCRYSSAGTQTCNNKSCQ